MSHFSETLTADFLIFWLPVLPPPSSMMFSELYIDAGAVICSFINWGFALYPAVVFYDGHCLTKFYVSQVDLKLAVFAEAGLELMVLLPYLPNGGMGDRGMLPYLALNILFVCLFYNLTAVSPPSSPSSPFPHLLYAILPIHSSISIQRRDRPPIDINQTWHIKLKAGWSNPVWGIEFQNQHKNQGQPLLLLLGVPQEDHATPL